MNITLRTARNIFVNDMSDTSRLEQNMRMEEKVGSVKEFLKLGSYR
jgi:hypothetical protein